MKLSETPRATKKALALVAFCLCLVSISAHSSPNTQNSVQRIVFDGRGGIVLPNNHSGFTFDHSPWTPQEKTSIVIQFSVINAKNTELHIQIGELLVVWKKDMLIFDCTSHAAQPVVHNQVNTIQDSQIQQIEFSAEKTTANAFTLVVSNPHTGITHQTLQSCPSVANNTLQIDKFSISDHSQLSHTRPTSRIHIHSVFLKKSNLLEAVWDFTISSLTSDDSCYACPHGKIVDETTGNCDADCLTGVHTFVDPTSPWWNISDSTVPKPDWAVQEDSQSTSQDHSQGILRHTSMRKNANMKIKTHTTRYLYDNVESACSWTQYAATVIIAPNDTCIVSPQTALLPGRNEVLLHGISQQTVRNILSSPALWNIGDSVHFCQGLSLALTCIKALRMTIIMSGQHKIWTPQNIQPLHQIGKLYRILVSQNMNITPPVTAN